MRLRPRVALLVGLSVAATVAGVTAVAAWAAERELFDPVDERLVARIVVIEEFTAEGEQIPRSRPLVVVAGDDMFSPVPK